MHHEPTTEIADLTGMTETSTTNATIAMPNVLHLQGPASPLWSELADAFEARGARTRKVHLAPSDALFWRRPGVLSYRGSLARWPVWLEALIARDGITDILCYADRLPFHAAAAEVAARLGVRFHVVENGYFRPDWITLERGGMGVRSHFPNDPEMVRERARGLPAPDFEIRHRHRFHVLAAHEVAQSLVDFFARPLYPGYRSERYYNTIHEYLSWFPRALVVPRLRKVTKAIERWSPDTRYWLFAMQLQADFQIRANSHWGHLSNLMERVIGSFAENAAPDERLVVKLHPHDNMMERWDRVAARIAARHGVADRVFTVIGGDLGGLIRRSRGVLLVNSTVGIHVLRAGKPLAVLGAAVYDMPGLAHAGPLDTFWRAPRAPDPELVDAFLRLLGATTQIKGDFYDPAGRAAAIAEIVDRVVTGRVNEPGGFVDPPPRLAAFLAAGPGGSTR